MKNILSILLIVLSISLSLSACTSQDSATAPSQTVAPVVTQMPTEVPPTQAPTDVPPTQEPEPTSAVLNYANEAFGLSFSYPSNWFGPDEYISGGILRLEVGSDVVYPYGTGREEQIYLIPNTYYVTLQYTQNDQVQAWNDTYQTLMNLQDGESLSGMRSLIIRVRALEMGRFSGFEYIATLSETAQTEPGYVRSVILVDPQTGDVLTMMGSPNNVDLSGGDWRQAYQAIDEANQHIFEQILESIAIQ